MLAYIEGIPVQLNPSQTYIDLNGLGYEVHITLHTYESIKGKEKVRLYTHLQIREDAWVLYGFATEKEKAAFQRLLSVSGVGAATARILLSSITADELERIIWNGEAKMLEKVKGIGAKTAQRIILELKGKIILTDPEINTTPHNTTMNDALYALLGLGIAKPMAEAALKKAAGQDEAELSTEALIKSALKNL
jgi:Holliday junction DNA helicase RuvA